MPLRTILVAATIAVTLMIGATSASGATTFGSSLSNAPNNGACGSAAGSTCGVAIADIPASRRATGGVNAPINGVVVRWRMRALPGTAVTTSAALRLYRGNTAVGSSTPQASALSGGIETFNTRMPIQAGDRLGLNLTQLGGEADAYAQVSYFESGGGTLDYFFAPPADGATLAPDGTTLNRELLVNADVEADADADGFGDETQDLCPTDAAVQIACADTTKPVATSLKLVAKRGFSFKSTEAGKYFLHVDRVFPGRKSGRKCSRTKKTGKRCEVLVKVKRKSDFVLVGSNEVLLSTKKFPPGRYKVSVLVVDAAGNSSKRVYRAFTVKKKKKKS